MDENLLGSNVSAPATAADQAINESMEALQKTSSLLERIQAQRQREAQASEPAQAQQAEVTEDAAAGPVTERQAATTTTKATEPQQSPPATTTSDDSNNTNNDVLHTNSNDNDDDNDLEMNNSGQQLNYSNDVQVPNYSRLSTNDNDDAIFSGNNGIRPSSSSGPSGIDLASSLGFSSFDFSGFTNTLFSQNDEHQHYYGGGDQSSEALLSEHVQSLSREYSMTSYFKMLIMDVYRFFQKMPVPIQIIVTLVSIWLVWKLI